MIQSLSSSSYSLQGGRLFKSYLSNLLWRRCPQNLFWGNNYFHYKWRTASLPKETFFYLQFRSIPFCQLASREQLPWCLYGFYGHVLGFRVQHYWKTRCPCDYCKFQVGKSCKRKQVRHQGFQVDRGSVPFRSCSRQLYSVKKYSYSPWIYPLPLQVNFNEKQWEKPFSKCLYRLQCALDSVVSDMFGKSATAITDYLISQDTFDPEHCVSLLQRSLKKKSESVLESIEGYSITQEQNFVWELSVLIWITLKTLFANWFSNWWYGRKTRKSYFASLYHSRCWP